MPDSEVLCYTFPHWHRTALNDRLYAPGWTEYRLMRGARPWFPGHHQPRTPELGELDERQPATWDVYDRLAADAGITGFVFDWYWYEQRPAFHEALEEGYLSGERRTGFAVMWTNHTWYRQLPTPGAPDVGDFQAMFGGTGQGARELQCEAPDDALEARRSLSYLVARYFHLPGYTRIDGRQLLVVWDAARLLRLYGRDGTSGLVAWLRQRAADLGHPSIHLHANQAGMDAFGQLAECGFDSYGVYNPIYLAAAERPDSEELTSYGDAVDDIIAHLWDRWDAMSELPFFPAIGPGWDSTPRFLQPSRPQTPSRRAWPGGELVVGETSAEFGRLARAALARADPGHHVVTIGSWNEWTEGQYLLPDTKHGQGMLRALGDAVRSARGGGRDG